jgi:hypothetical protein
MAVLWVGPELLLLMTLAPLSTAHRKAAIIADVDEDPSLLEMIASSSRPPAGTAFGATRQPWVLVISSAPGSSVENTFRATNVQPM